MDRRTVDVYEQRAVEWREQKERPLPSALDPFVSRVPPGMRVDIGCGPGWHSARLGAPVVAMDAAWAMLEQVPTYAPGALRVQADLERLPFRAGAFTGAWAHKSYMHVPAGRVPMALAELHRSLVVGAAVHLQVTCDQLPPEWDDPFTGRHFSYFTTAQFVDVVEGAGFEVLSSGDDGEEWVDVEATRARMLPDTVGPEMRLLLVGLNPSLLSADTGVGFARPGNRFWPAALASGLATRTHDPYHLLREHGVGMTNLVRRATVGAAELTNEEYREGAARVTRLAEWLQPRAICFVGLTGYRVAVDKKAKLGWQETAFASTPTYVMPNTSGLNAHAKPADFAAHLRATLRVPA